MTENQRTAAHWDRVLTTGDNSFSPEVYWMAVPEVHKRIQRLSTGGALTAKGVPYDVWFQYCVFEFLAAWLPVERMLSVGCGTGDLERNLALYNCFKHMDACDISPAAIAVARQKAVEMEIHNITFIASDIAKFPLPAEHYDVVWFNSSLHHIKDLEGTCAAIARTLKPDGFVFLNVCRTKPLQAACPPKRCYPCGLRSAAQALQTLICATAPCAGMDERASAAATAFTCSRTH